MGENSAKVRSTALSRLESLLAARQLDGTVTKAEMARETGRCTPTGIASLDDVLQGGWRRGEVSEVIGSPSSGRAGVVAATLAAVTMRGEIVGLVDAFDRLDPITMAATGVEMSRVLWVRGPALTLPGRPALVAAAVTQAVRAFDLILRAGGFGVVVLDVAGAPARAFHDLAPATWLRLSHAMAGQPTVGLLVGDVPMGRSARGVTVRLTSARQWTGTSPQSRRLAGLDVRAQVERAQRPVSTAPGWTLRAAG